MAYLIPSLLCPLMMLVCMGGLRLPWKRRAGRDMAPRDRVEEIALLQRRQVELAERLEALSIESPDQDDGVPPRRAAG